MVAHSSNIRLSGLSIGFAGRTEAANGLYANGRHQCEVVIDVVKETRGPDGEWIATPLTDEERASVTVVEWSEHDTQTLTQGWSCDAQRNEFALGLWRDGSAQEHQDTEVDAWVDHTQGERISRYLRCDPDAPIGPAVLMARAVIDGVVYTSQGSTNGIAFESTVTISSVAPLQLGVADLELFMDVAAYFSDGDDRTRVDVYYWTPPAGISFVKNIGFDIPLGIPGEGKDFHSTFIHQNPLESDTNKAGTFINKDDPDSLLYLNEIHEGLPLPSPNPLVRFNERPTIMRAIRLKSKLVAEGRDTKSAWRLLDNYGTEHRFFLAPATGVVPPGFPYLLLKDTLVQPRLRLTHFEIKLPNGGVSTNELYANGRHQCKVVVEVIAEQMQPDGNWAAIRLTQAQHNSLTITRYSANVNEPLPRGWSCDHVKNIYDAGLWNAASEEGEQNKSIVMEVRSSDIQMEVVDRYLRLDANTPIEDMRFMASINVGGVTYTTNYTKEDVQFDSYISIRAVQPYRLLAQNLVGHVDVSAYNDDKCDIDVYYWVPPNGVRFIVNRGLSAFLSVDYAGLNFRASYDVKDGQGAFNRAGIVVNKDVPNPSVLLADIFTRPPNAYQRYVRFDRYQTIMRAVRCRGKYNTQFMRDSRAQWRLWDNFGCEHVFGFGQADSGNVINLIDG